MYTYNFHMILSNVCAYLSFIYDSDAWIVRKYRVYYELLNSNLC
jgi:hypothetical protein